MANTHTISLRNNMAELETLAAEIQAFGKTHGLSEETVFKANLILEEIAANIINYGFDDGAEHSIDIRMSIENGELILDVEDDAREFDPLKAKEPDVTQPLEERPIGGLGIFFVRHMADEVVYRRQQNRNRLRIRKAL